MPQQVRRLLAYQMRDLHVKLLAAEQEELRGTEDGAERSCPIQNPKNSIAKYTFNHLIPQPPSMQTSFVNDAV